MRAFDITGLFSALTLPFPGRVSAEMALDYVSRFGTSGDDSGKDGNP